MVKEDLNNLKSDIERIKKMGFMQCDYHCPGSAGINLEKLLGINPENFEIPDYKSIEIKTKRSTIKKEINLFCLKAMRAPHYMRLWRIADIFQKTF